ncbi:MAG TPA: hydrogenase maturation protease [Drouetiella sp.]
MLSIIGCGNTNRGDDGAGIYVVRQLKTRLPAAASDNVRIFDAGTGGMDVMFQARGSSSLIIIDASRNGAEPGAVFQIPGKELELKHTPSFGLHDFRWDHALYAGRQIFKEEFPKDVQVFLIEAANLDFGLELTDVVKAAADRVVKTILEDLIPSSSQSNQKMQASGSALENKLG